MTPPKDPRPAARSVVAVDDNYLIMTRAVVDGYRIGLDLNYAEWAMTSAVPSLLADSTRLRQVLRAIADIENPTKDGPLGKAGLIPHEYFYRLQKMARDAIEGKP